MEQNRARSGIKVSLAGVIVNLILAAAKITAGAFCGLLSVMADGFNNLSDCGSGAVSLVSFHVSAKPADKEHPYGHRRAEYVASVITGCLVLFMAVELLRESVVKAIEGGVYSAEYWLYAVLAVSVAVKGGLFFFYRAAAKKLSSEALKAASVDAACDCVATLAVIAGTLVYQFTGFPADGYAGSAVAVFIGYQGVRLIGSSASKLLGQGPDAALVKSFKKLLTEGEGVIGVHDIRAFSFGGEGFYASAHVEMSSEVPPLKAHAVIDGLEHLALEKLNVSAVIHLDPVDLNDAEARRLESSVRELLKDFYPGLELHDFRLVRGVKNKLVFDAVLPFSVKEGDAEVKEQMENAVRSALDIIPVITVERQ